MVRLLCMDVSHLMGSRGAPAYSILFCFGLFGAAPSYWPGAFHALLLSDWGSMVGCSLPVVWCILLFKLFLLLPAVLRFFVPSQPLQMDTSIAVSSLGPRLISPALWATWRGAATPPSLKIGWLGDRWNRFSQLPHICFVLKGIDDDGINAGIFTCVLVGYEVVWTCIEKCQLYSFVA